MESFVSKFVAKAKTELSELMKSKKNFDESTLIPIVGYITYVDNEYGKIKIKLHSDIVDVIKEYEQKINREFTHIYKDNKYLNLRIINTKVDKPYAFADIYLLNKKKKVNTNNVQKIEFETGSLVYCWIRLSVFRDKVYATIAGKESEKIMFLYQAQSQYENLISSVLDE